MGKAIKNDIILLLKKSKVCIFFLQNSNAILFNKKKSILKNKTSKKIWAIIISLTFLKTI